MYPGKCEVAEWHFNVTGEHIIALNFALMRVIGIRPFGLLAFSQANICERNRR